MHLILLFIQVIVFSGLFFAIIIVNKKNGRSATILKTILITGVVYCIVNQFFNRYNLIADAHFFSGNKKESYYTSRSGLLKYEKSRIPEFLYGKHSLEAAMYRACKN